MSRFPRVLASGAVLVVVAAASFSAGTRLGGEPEGFDEVADVAGRIQERSVTDVPDAVLVRAAIRGMLQVLDDPYATYLDPARAQEARDLLSGSFVGLGLWLEEVPGGMRVTSVLPGSPAGHAGIVPGDVVAEADGRPLAELSAPEAMALLQGPEGSEVALLIRHGEESRRVELERTRISATDVQPRLLHGEVAYVHPLRFGEGTADALRAGLEDLLDRGARALVLDLRGNPGGLAEEAVRAASLFVSEGVVARARSAGGGEEELTVEGDPLEVQVPMAVLVDGTTASAAELLAGALQDRDRAAVVGMQTFGKGAALTVEGVAGGSAVRFTTAYFVTPDGHAIEGRGIVPDVAVVPGGPTDAQLDRAVRIVLEEVEA